MTALLVVCVIVCLALGAALVWALGRDGAPPNGASAPPAGDASDALPGVELPGGAGRAALARPDPDLDRGAATERTPPSGGGAIVVAGAVVDAGLEAWAEDIADALDAERRDTLEGAEEALERLERVLEDARARLDGDPELPLLESLIERIRERADDPPRPRALLIPCSRRVRLSAGRWTTCRRASSGVDSAVAEMPRQRRHDAHVRRQELVPGQRIGAGPGVGRHLEVSRLG